jgi:hypothetical protein
MRKIKLTGKGDNVYTHQFSTMSGVYSFLYSILDNIERCEWENLPMFDVEDDQIILETPDGKYSCNGWHWFENDGHKELLMPDGESFYSKVSKLS